MKRKHTINEIAKMFLNQDFEKYGVADPKKNCKHCFGRGYIGKGMAPVNGKMVVNDVPIPCKCILSYTSKGVRFKDRPKPKEEACKQSTEN